VSDTDIQRRLAAILAADVVGYSKMMGEDEAGTLAAVRKLRAEVIEPKIAEHQGRLFKTTGDGFLAEFPSVVNAVACAAAIQTAMAGRNADQPQDRQLQLRIGVNLGDIIAEADDLFGDGVNVAARLEGLASPGGVVISGAAYDQIGTRLGLKFEDMGGQTLKNIASPVRAYRIGDEAGAADPGSAATLTRKVSVAVLPFDNMSGDPGQQYISDGITEDITTELARFSGLTVASRLAAFHYGGKGKSPVEAARPLGVAYVVEGSVRKSGSRLRITAQLIDARTGNHVWADRYDRDLADVFAVEDEVVTAIVSMLEGRMATAEAAVARTKPTNNWSAYDFFLQGRELCNRNRDSEAVPFLNKAVSIDPQFALAHAWLAIALTVSNVYSRASDPSFATRANDAADRALELDTNDAASQWAKAMVLLWRGDNVRARPYFERALALNPSDIQIQGDYASWQRESESPEKALATIDKLISKGPFVPEWFTIVRGLALFDLTRYVEAIDCFENLPSHSVEAWLCLVAACAQIGDVSGTEKALSKLVALRPDLTLNKVANLYGYKTPDRQEHLVTALRKAGLPE
jgi:adenylate cyclase